MARCRDRIGRAIQLSRLERADVAMLLLPVFLVSLTIAVAQWTDARLPAQGVAAGQGYTIAEGSRRALVGLPRTAVEARRVGPGIQVPEARPGALSETATRELEATALASAPGRPDVVAADTPSLSAPMPEAGTTPSASGSERQVAAVAVVPDDLPIPAAVPPGGAVSSPEPEATVPVLTAPQEAFWGLDDGETQCRLTKAAPAAVARDVSGLDGDSFGIALAEAAREQLDDFVIYNDRYARLRYPMGDVHPMYGVCTDVIIRAYRALGIDLQALVQTTRSGSGDASIDHRRVDTLRKFFGRFGEILPISSFAEDFRPGDIVTYWRPQNRHSRTHIAIVSDLASPSGRPLIIHNRGWGPQQEDGLFVDKITGHFRFSGLKGAPAMSGPAGTGAPSKPVSNRTGMAKTSVIRAGLAAPEATRPGPRRIPGK